MNADNPNHCACCHCVRQAGDFTYRRGVRARCCNVCRATNRSRPALNGSTAFLCNPKLHMSILGKL